jgi:uncharacterized coiled-coil DUF342 family protein
MAKKIKFNLILDGKDVRDLDGLRKNFNLDDLLSYFQSELLHRWLDVRGFHKELNMVRTLSKDSDLLTIGKGLIEIFHNESSEDDLYHLLFLQERRETLQRILQNAESHQDIIDEYHKRYELLKSKMFENSNNFEYVKGAVREIEKSFFPLFRLEAKELLGVVVKEYILVAMAILLNRNLRDFILKNRDISSKLSGVISLRDDMIKEIYNQFKSLKGVDNSIKAKIKNYRGDTSQQWIRLEDEDVLVLQSNAGTKLREPIESENEISHVYAKGTVLRGLEFQSFKESHFVKYISLKDIDGFIGAVSQFRGETDGYWKDIEMEGRDYLILKIGDGCYIRSLGNHGEELSTSDVNNKFPILRGIDYKSNSKTETIYYIKG